MIKTQGTADQLEALFHELRRVSIGMPKVLKDRQTPVEGGRNHGSVTYEGYLAAVRPVLAAAEIVMSYSVDEVVDLPSVDRGMGIVKNRIRVYVYLHLIHTAGAILSVRGVGDAQDDDGEFLLASATTHARRSALVGALALVTTDHESDAVPLRQVSLPPDDRVLSQDKPDAAPAQVAAAGEDDLTEEQRRTLLLDEVRKGMIKLDLKLAQQNAFCKESTGKSYPAQMTLPELKKLKEDLKKISGDKAGEGSTVAVA